MHSIRLILLGRVDAGGLLIFDHICVGDRPLVVRLDGRHTRLLRVLTRHWRLLPDDELNGGPPFVPVNQIASEFYDDDELAFPPDEQSVRAYAAQINRLIRKATPKSMLAPKVHEAARLLGYRLVQQLEIGSIK
jgi:hypothetical protein